MGKRALQHRSRAEVYAIQGQLSGAIEQLQIAQKAGDADFYENSAVDARLRELRAAQAEEAKNKRE
jgi:predicted Zn-dependent protease